MFRFEFRTGVRGYFVEFFGYMVMFLVNSFRLYIVNWGKEADVS